MFQFPLVVLFHSVESSWVSRQEFQSFSPVGIGNAISYGLNTCKETKKAKPVAMGQILKKKIVVNPKTQLSSSKFMFIGFISFYI